MNEMNTMAIKELHLAAYIKTHGGKFLGFENKRFRFESEKTEEEWRVAHSNSCCRRVDMELISLRKFLTSK
jgi:hypothetical protein